MEELCSLWTPNVNKWFGGTKECLTHYGYTEDKPIQLVGFSKEGNYYFQWKHLFSVAILLSFSNFLLDFHDATGNLLLDLTFKYAIIYKCIDMYETHHANQSYGNKSGTWGSTLTNLGEYVQAPSGTPEAIGAETEAQLLYNTNRNIQWKVLLGLIAFNIVFGKQVDFMPISIQNSFVKHTSSYIALQDSYSSRRVDFKKCLF